MEYYILFCIFLFGTLFGSFSSVIISRIKSGKGGILNGRSECPKCNHVLSSKDLIPVISHILSEGKCRYCKAKISYIYPILEVVMGFIFMLTAYILIDINLIISLDLTEIIKLIFYLLLSFLTMIFVVYDIKYLEIPDSIIGTAVITTILVLIYQTLSSQVILFTIPPSYPDINSIINYSAIALVILIIGGLYAIMLAGLHELIDILILIVSILSLYVFHIYFNIDLTIIPILNGVIGVLGIFLFFFIQILVSRGKWMGGGDLRIAILIGLILGVSYSFAGIMTAYFSGSLIGIIFIIYQKIKARKMIENNILSKIKKAIGFNIKTPNIDTQIPFGPFLAIGLFTILFYGNQIISIVEKYLG